MSIIKKAKKEFGKAVEYVLCHSQPIVNLLQANSTVRSHVNTMLIDMAIGRAPARPYPLSTLSDYSSWDSLTDRTYCGRHLAPLAQAEIDKLPSIQKDVLPLFSRSESGMRPCKKSTVLFSYFAQWFTDAFLRTTRQADGHYDPNLKNTSPHDVDLCNLYGMKWNVFGQARNDVQLLRSMQGELSRARKSMARSIPRTTTTRTGRPRSSSRTCR